MPIFPNETARQLEETLLANHGSLFQLIRKQQEALAASEVILPEDRIQLLAASPSFDLQWTTEQGELTSLTLQGHVSYQGQVYFFKNTVTGEEQITLFLEEFLSIGEALPSAWMIALLNVSEVWPLLKTTLAKMHFLRQCHRLDILTYLFKTWADRKADKTLYLAFCRYFSEALCQLLEATRLITRHFAVDEHNFESLHQLLPCDDLFSVFHSDEERLHFVRSTFAVLPNALSLPDDADVTLPYLRAPHPIQSLCGHYQPYWMPRTDLEIALIVLCEELQQAYRRCEKRTNEWTRSDRSKRREHYKAAIFLRILKQWESAREVYLDEHREPDCDVSMLVSNLERMARSTLDLSAALVWEKSPWLTRAWSLIKKLLSRFFPNLKPWDQRPLELMSALKSRIMRSGGNDSLSLVAGSESASVPILGFMNRRHSPPTSDVASSSAGVVDFEKIPTYTTIADYKKGWNRHAKILLKALDDFVLLLRNDAQNQLTSQRSDQLKAAHQQLCAHLRQVLLGFHPDKQPHIVNADLEVRVVSAELFLLRDIIRDLSVTQNTAGEFLFADEASVSLLLKLCERLGYQPVHFAQSIPIPTGGVSYAEFTAQMQNLRDFLTRCRQEQEAFFKEFQAGIARYDGILSDIERMNADTKRMNSDIRAKYDYVDQTYERLDQTYERLDQTYERFGETCEKIGETYTGIDESYSGIVPALARVEEGYGRLNDDFEKIFSRIEDAKHRRPSENLARSPSLGYRSLHEEGPPSPVLTHGVFAGNPRPLTPEPVEPELPAPVHSDVTSAQ